MAEEYSDSDGSDDDAEENCHHGYVAIGAFLGCCSALTKYPECDPKGAGDNAQRPDDAENAGGRNRSNADEPDIAAIDLHCGHVGNRNACRIDSAVEMTAD